MQSKNGTADHTVLDHMTDAELTQLVIDLSGMLCEVKTDPTFFQACGDGIQTVCCCDINAVDSTGIYDHYPGVFSDAVLNIFLKNLYICKKQVFTETVDHNALNRVGETVFGQIKISISSRIIPRKERGGLVAFRITATKESRIPMITP